MFDLDKWQEVFATIKKNKLRTFLTSFSVAWGIFMLVVLLGAGNGLYNGVKSQFDDYAMNSMTIHTDVTSLAYNGLNSGRKIRLTNDDFEFLQREYPSIDKISTINFRWGLNVNYKDQYGTYSALGVYPDFQNIRISKMIHGRYINDLDEKEERKSVVLSYGFYTDMCKSENPVGDYLKIAGIPFKIVGVFGEKGSDWENRQVHIPHSVAQKVFKEYRYVDRIAFSYGNLSLEQSIRLREELQKRFSKKFQVDPKDRRALFIRNLLEDFMQYGSTLRGMSVFIWIIGIMTIVAGIVGVSNIMIIIVKERTKEIGLRKAIGATPLSIVSLIMFEAIIITAFAGYLGLLAGILVLEAVGKNFQADYFKQPEVDLSIAIYTILVLTIAGALAGLVPAIKAAYIKPIEALRDE